MINRYLSTASRLLCAVVLAMICMAAPHARAQAPAITDSPNSLVTIYTFTGTNGSNPLDGNGLLQVSGGQLIGTTGSGGSSNNGTVFEISTAGVLSWVSSFNGNNGQYPNAGVVSGSDGNYYGTTYFGGGNNDGSVYRVSGSGTINRIFSFTDNNGRNGSGKWPRGGLTFDAQNQRFYGLTENGGRSANGTLYDIDENGNQNLDLSFVEANNGAFPHNALLNGGNEIYYGGILNGGTGGDGTIVEYSANQNQIVVLHNFSGPDGSGPRELVKATNGLIYGATLASGSFGGGTVFSITTSGSLNTLVQLSSTTGFAINGALMQASDGNLYATASSGGANGDGTVFMMTTSGSLTPILSFSGTSGPVLGSEPGGVLVEGTDHNLYGTTTTGGAKNDGTVFCLTRSATATQLTTSFSYQITASNTPTSFKATGLPTGVTVNSTGLISGTPTTNGTFTVVLSASNTKGIGTAPLTLVVQKEPVPVVTSTSTVSGTGDFAFSTQVTATNLPTSYSALNLPTGLAIDPSTGLISGTPTVDGSFSPTVSAINVGGTGSAILPIVLAVPPAPSLTGTVQESGTGDYGFDYQINNGGYAATFTGLGLPTGVTVDPSTGLITGTPTQTGTFSGTLTAVNLGGTASESFDLVVATPPPPTITSDLSATGTTQTEFDYQIETAANAASYSSTGLPSGLSLNDSTGLISGTPTATGTFSGSISALNLGGTDTEAFTVTVLLHPPVVSSALTATGTVGKAFSYQTSANFGPTGYDATGLPGGLTIDPSSGIISGTPVTNGTFGVVLSATNTGGAGEATLALTIDANFITAAGAYNGLGSLGGTNVALTTFTLARTAAFSGRVENATTAYALTGKFNPAGFYSGSKVVGKSIYVSNLALDGSAKTINGTVSIVTATGTTTYAVQTQGYGVFNPRTSPAASAGRYTFIIPQISGTSVAGGPVPQFQGFGTITVTTTGVVVVVGKLGDATSFVDVSHLHADGTSFTLFDRLYAGRAPGSVAGNIVFSSGTASDADGDLDWIKPAQLITVGNYLKGFTVQSQFLGAKYAKAPFTPGSPAVSGTAAFILGGGALASPAITDSLLIPAVGRITVSGVNMGSITLSILPTTGVFSGTFIDPTTNRRAGYGGVIYQKPSPEGFGLFLSGSQAGGVEINP
jgi:uncharacterized repeat protein (TIGR03803 family)